MGVWSILATASLLSDLVGLVGVKAQGGQAVPGAMNENEYDYDLLTRCRELLLDWIGWARSWEDEGQVFELEQRSTRLTLEIVEAQARRREAGREA